MQRISDSTSLSINYISIMQKLNVAEQQSDKHAVLLKLTHKMPEIINICGERKIIENSVTVSVTFPWNFTEWYKEVKLTNYFKYFIIFDKATVFLI